VDAVPRQIIAVGEFLVLGRSLQTAAHPHPLTVLIIHQRRSADEKHSRCGHVAAARVHGFDGEGQIGIGVALIGRLGQRACDQHLIFAVVVKSDVKGVNCRLAELKPPRTKEEEGGQDEEIIMGTGKGLESGNLRNFRQAREDEEEDEEKSQTKPDVCWQSPQVGKDNSRGE